MSAWNLAQINVGTALYPLDAPGMADFMNQLDEINALAETSPGFVWRLKDEAGDATGIKVSDDPKFIVNMSVWSDVDALFAFVYRSDHQAVMARRREWFQRPTGAFQALWWVPTSYEPPIEEGLARIALLEREGPTAGAFTFKSAFPPPSHPISRPSQTRHTDGQSPDHRLPRARKLEPQPPRLPDEPGNDRDQRLWRAALRWRDERCGSEARH